jgi:16S rRNA (guanine966-N2)-methyltransferase
VAVGRAESVLARGPGDGPPRDMVFADPPYSASAGEVTAVLVALLAPGWLVPGALVVVERATRSGPLSWPAGYAPDRARKYGEATLWYGRAAGAVRSGPP